MPPKGSQNPLHRSKVQQRQRLAPLRGAYAAKPLAGGVANARPPANSWQASGLAPVRASPNVRKKLDRRDNPSKHGRFILLQTTTPHGFCETAVPLC